MLFASRAQASPATGGALAATREAVQLPEPAASVVAAQTTSSAANGGAIVQAALAVAERVSSAGGSPPQPAPSGATGDGAATGGGAPAPSEPAPPAQSEPDEVAPAESGPPPAEGVASPAQAVASALEVVATQPQARSALAGAIATVATVQAANGAQRNETSKVATASDRERQAQAALRRWSLTTWREDVALSLFVPDLQRFIAQFQSLARDITAASAAAAPSKVAGAAAQELALILTAANTPATNALADGLLLRAGDGSAAGLSALAFARRLAVLSAAARIGETRALQRTSVATPTATSPTVASWLPSAAGAALGSGMTGAAVPAAALLAVAAVCLLGTWLPRRLADNGLACKSALLNLRLERPG
jgi:hypothetical protein